MSDQRLGRINFEAASAANPEAPDGGPPMGWDELSAEQRAVWQAGAEAVRADVAPPGLMPGGTPAPVPTGSPRP